MSPLSPSVNEYFWDSFELYWNAVAVVVVVVVEAAAIFEFIDGLVPAVFP